MAVHVSDTKHAESGMESNDPSTQKLHVKTAVLPSGVGTQHPQPENRSRNEKGVAAAKDLNETKHQSFKEEERDRHPRPMMLTVQAVVAYQGGQRDLLTLPVTRTTAKGEDGT